MVVPPRVFTGVGAPPHNPNRTRPQPAEQLPDVVTHTYADDTIALVNLAGIPTRSAPVQSGGWSQDPGAETLEDQARATFRQLAELISGICRERPDVRAAAGYLVSRADDPNSDDAAKMRLVPGRIRYLRGLGSGRLAEGVDNTRSSTESECVGVGIEERDSDDDTIPTLVTRRDEDEDESSDEDEPFEDQEAVTTAEQTNDNVTRIPTGVGCATLGKLTGVGTDASSKPTGVERDEPKTLKGVANDLLDEEGSPKADGVSHGSGDTSDWTGIHDTPTAEDGIAIKEYDVTCQDWSELRAGSNGTSESNFGSEDLSDARSVSLGARDDEIMHDHRSALEPETRRADVHGDLTGLVNHGERKADHDAQQYPGGNHDAGSWSIPYNGAERTNGKERQAGKVNSDSVLTEWSEADDWKYAEKSNQHGRTKSRTGPKQWTSHVKVLASHVESGSKEGSAGIGDGSGFK